VADAAKLMFWVMCGNSPSSPSSIEVHSGHATRSGRPDESGLNMKL